MTVERVLITGASSGIGAALARQYANRHAHLILIGRRAEPLRAVAEDVGGMAFIGHVADPEVIAAATAHAHSVWGGLDVVIANAGYALSGEFADLTCGDYRRQFETNVFGVLTTIEHTLPLLRSSRGRLVIIGSLAGTLSPPGRTAYAMSKAALRPLADGLRTEIAASGVSVTLITPGLIESCIGRRNRRGDLDPAVQVRPSRLAMPAAVAARHMLRAIDARRREAVITAHGRLLMTLWHLAPWLVQPWLARARQS